ncbi:MAG: hypothetical protein C0410_07185 [Anaerolinea sp.]|nr:hypothetical protein [Anaerolinea sp.]
MRAQKPQLVIPGVASPYRRLGARVIDLAFCGFLIFPLAMITGSAIGASIKVTEEQNTAIGLLSFVFFVLLMVIYDAVMNATAGRTLGKMALGLRVVDINGEKLGWGSAFLRSGLMYLLGILIAAGIAVTASILGWVLISGLGRYQVFPHDSATKTYVMTKGQAGPVQMTLAAATPHDDLEKLRQSGLISEEEYQRKRKELGY